jgi:hypothetical protein
MPLTLNIRQNPHNLMNLQLLYALPINTIQFPKIAFLYQNPKKNKEMNVDARDRTYFVVTDLYRRAW